MIQSDAARLVELGVRSDLPFVTSTNILTAGTITSTRAVLTDGALANAISGTTYDYWLPNMSGTTVTYSASFAASKRVTFAGIVGHNIGTLGGTVQVRRSTDGGATFTDAGCGVVTPTNDEPIGFRMITNASNMAADWQFLITVAAADPLQVAGLFMGVEKIFPVGLYDGFAPPIFPNDVQLQSNVSVGGNFLGSSIIAQGSSLSASMAYMPPDFVRTDLAAFIPNFNAGKPFWFAWRPETFPADLRYCWREGDVIKPVNSGGLDFMAFTMSMRAYES